MKKKKTPAKKKRSGFIRKILLGFFLILLGFVVFAAVEIFKLDTWQEFEPEKILNADETLIIYDKNGAEISLLHALEDRITIPITQIPDHVQKAFIAAEDTRFYEHTGVDFIRIIGAAINDIKSGTLDEGASTINQQLIKMSHLTPEKTFGRKLQEAVLAYQMEGRFDKTKILEMYLNFIYFGGGYYGVEAAARGYFGVHASELTPAQGAMLAGIIKAPSRYAPHLKMESSVKRRNLILSLMQEQGYITAEQCAEGQDEEVVLVREDAQKRGYYIDAALKKACKELNINMDTLLRGGYRIYTCMDFEMQEFCEEIFDDPETFPNQSVEGAIVVTQPGTGYVEALVGGRESDVAMAFNRATDIRRQPGSVIKPIIAYAPALENYGYTTTTMILDEPTSFGSYMPNNFGSKYYGWVTMREAVMRSLNVPAVKVFSSIGVEEGKRFASKLGIEFDKEDQSLALVLGGFTYGVSPYQIASAYACFANGGIYTEPTMILRITDKKGEVLYQHKNSTQRVMSEQNAYILTDMLRSAIKEGTGKRLGELNMPLAGKTGTVGEGGGNRDAWMAAYNTEHCAAVWMGYDSSKEGYSMPGEATGGTFPALVLHDLFEYLYKDDTAPDFVMPKGVKTYRLDRHTLDSDKTAVLANALTPVDDVLYEVYVDGTEPVSVSTYWSIPAPPDDLTIELEGGYLPHITFTAADVNSVYKLIRQDITGNIKTIGEWEGTTYMVSVYDPDITLGEVYGYYIIPVHPQLKIGERNVTGPASQVIEVRIPQSIGNNGDWFEDAG